MVKKIKNLMLYVIYENNMAVCLLRRNWLTGRIHRAGENGDVGESARYVKITGHTAGERIAPFIILPLIENGFHQLSRLEIPGKFIDIWMWVEKWEFSDEGRLEETYRQLYIDQWKQSLSAEYQQTAESAVSQSHEMKVVITRNSLSSI